MGLKSRVKGKVFERLIATKLRARFPDLAGEIKRTIQSRGGRQEGADVVGLPFVWLECQHADNSTPLQKLEQAERDSAGSLLLPVAVTRRTGSREIVVTMRVKDLEQMLYFGTEKRVQRGNTPVALSFEDFLDLYEDRFRV